MTRIIGFAAVLAVFGVVTVSHAVSDEHMSGGGMMKHGKMMDRDSTGQMCTMGCGMGMMIPRQILVVEDGIIVSVGNKLIKYDKDLNKKKEVAIEIDAAAMKTMMEQMHQTRSKQKDTLKPVLEPQKKK